MCQHNIQFKNRGSHFHCKCCDTGCNAAVMNGPNGRNVCLDCYEPISMPKPVNFEKEVRVTGVVGNCMFCGTESVIQFESGENICKGCVK